MQTQVVIIGAGPTGLNMAAQLIRYNIDFVIIDKNKGTTSLSKALVVHARTLEILKELGIDKKAIEEGQETKVLNLVHRGKLKAAIDVSRMGEGMSEYPYVLSLEQSKTEEILYGYLLAHHKNVFWQCEFTHLTQNENGITAFYKNKDGGEEEVDAQYLIGCDGAGSLVRHQVGLSFEGATEPKLFYVADVILKSDVINKKEFYFFLTKKGFILFFSMEGEGHYRIVGILPNTANPDTAFQFKDIQPLIQKDVECFLEFTELKWFSTYKIHTRRANEFYKDRCFICGDAGHIHTPAGGQGMNTGIQDAYNLAWKMALHIKGWVNNEVVKTYATERVQNADHLLKTTDRLFDMMAGTNIFWNFFRQNIFPFIANLLSHSSFAKRKVFPLVSQTDIAYPDSYLTEKSAMGNVKAGDRMPYFITGNKSVYDSLVHPVFKILYFGKSEIQNNTFTSVLPFEMHVFKETPAAVFGKEKDFYVLLRPDNHISYIGHEISACFNFLNTISKNAS